MQRGVRSLLLVPVILAVVSFLAGLHLSFTSSAVVEAKGEGGGGGNDGEHGGGPDGSGRGGPDSGQGGGRGGDKGGQAAGRGLLRSDR